jgi:hypothetical protein
MKLADLSVGHDSVNAMSSVSTPGGGTAIGTSQRSLDFT